MSNENTSNAGGVPPIVPGSPSPNPTPSPKSEGFSIVKVGRFLRTFPWTLLLIVVSVILEAIPNSSPFRGTPVDYSMVVFAMVVLVLELAKSTDIRKTRFLTDLIVAVIGLVVSTALVTFYIVKTGTSPAFYHWVVVSVITIDAILSPTISFSTALRNMSVADVS